MQNTISWFIQNATWELAIIIVLAVMARIYKSIWKKTWHTKQEAIFWATTIIGGFAILAIGNIGIMEPTINQREQMEKDYLRASRPDLTCSIGVVGTGILMPQNITSVRVLAVIINRGAPSVARSWTLEAKLLSGEVIKATAEAEINTNVVLKEAGATLSSENYLPELFTHNPVPSGAAMDGWAHFLFDRKYFDELNRSGVIYKLSFYDSDQVLTEALQTNLSSKMWMN